jgi:hypothetical protein
MYSAVRSYATTGVALVAAGVIAVSPVTPVKAGVPNPATPVASPAVQLAVAPSPLVLYPQVVERTLRNVEDLALSYVALGYGLATAPFNPAEQGEPQPAVILFAPAILLLSAVTIASPVVCGILAAQHAFDDVSTAIAKSDPGDVVNAVIDIPALIADGVLNGTSHPSDPLSVGLVTAPGPVKSGPSQPGPLMIPLVITALILEFVGIGNPPPYDDEDDAVTTGDEAAPRTGKARIAPGGPPFTTKRSASRIRVTTGIMAGSHQVHTVKKVRRQTPASASRSMSAVRKSAMTVSSPKE